MSPLNVCHQSICVAWKFINWNPPLALSAVAYSCVIYSLFQQHIKNKQNIENNLTELNTLALHPEKFGFSKVDSKVRDKINIVLSDCCVTPTRILLIVNNQPEFDTFQAAGSLEKNKMALIIISKRAHEKIKNADTLPSDVLFGLRHEIKHLKSDDWYNLYLQSNKIAEISRIVFFILFSLPFVFKGGSLLVSCFFGMPYTANFLSERFIVPFAKLLRRQREIEADLFAAQNEEARKGGIQFFEKITTENLKVRNQSLLGMLLVDEKGNSRFDFDHPPFTDRIERLKSLAP